MQRVDIDERDSLGALIAAMCGGIAERTAVLWAHELLERHDMELVAEAVRRVARQHDRATLRALMEHCDRLTRERDPGVRALAAPPARLTIERRQAMRAVYAATVAGIIDRSSDRDAIELYRDMLAIGPVRARQTADAMWTEAGLPLAQLDDAMGRVTASMGAAA